MSPSAISSASSEEPSVSTPPLNLNPKHSQSNRKFQIPSARQPSQVVSSKNAKPATIQVEVSNSDPGLAVPVSASTNAASSVARQTPKAVVFIANAQTSKSNARVSTNAVPKVTPPHSSKFPLHLTSANHTCLTLTSKHHSLSSTSTVTKVE